MAKVVTFGEIMLRLSPPGFERLFQSPTLQATFGGGEANVAVSLAQSHLYADACLYQIGLGVADDDGGSASDEAAVVVTGNADLSMGSGWWLNQYRPKPPNDFSDAQLQCYLDIVTFFSARNPP